MADTPEQVLPPVQDGELATIRQIKATTCTTRPPVRYTEGLLIADMEGAAKYVEDKAFSALLKSVSGLGTGATRAAIIEGLKRRELLALQGKHLISTEKGRALIKTLPDSLYDIAETARWEAELDAIASGQGSHTQFESRILQRVADHVQVLKTVTPAAPRVTHPSHNQPRQSKGVPMSSTSAPTEKMLAYAERLAAAFKVDLPAEASASFEGCKAFIEQHANKPFPPSEKALAFANNLAEKSGISIPADVLAESKKLSAWIDEHK